MLESEHRHKALVESGVRELKENFGLSTLRKHGFMANWAWLLIVATGLNLCRWTQLLGELGADGDLRAKRLRYRYLAVPALLVRSGRRLVLKLHRGYAFIGRFVAALARLPSAPRSCRLTPVPSPSVERHLAAASVRSTISSQQSPSPRTRRFEGGLPRRRADEKRERRLPSRLGAPTDAFQ